MDNLPELRDIHLPSTDISVFPLAYGWWLVLATIVAIVLPLTCKLLIEECLLRFLIVVLLCVVTVSFSVLYVGCTSSERSTIMNKAIQILNRIKKK